MQGNEVPKKEVVVAGCFLGCPGTEVIGSRVIGSVGHNPNKKPMYKWVK